MYYLKCAINRNISKISISCNTWEHEGFSDWSWSGMAEQLRRFKGREVLDLKPDRCRIKELNCGLEWAGRRKRVNSEGAKMAENGVEESKADIWITVAEISLIFLGVLWFIFIFSIVILSAQYYGNTSILAPMVLLNLL